MAESEANDDDNVVETDNPYEDHEKRYGGDFEGYYR